MRYRFLTDRFSFSVILVLAMVAAVCPVFAQQEKNNIYLFDCTGSMQKGALWGPAKDALDATISTQTAIPGSMFTIIPFGDNPYDEIVFGANNYLSKKKDIEASFNDCIKRANYTRISDVLRLGMGKTDPKKENKIYLLTDGEPNGGDSPQAVARVIDEWCANHHNTRLFYVALKENVVNSTIRDAIDRCEDAYVVQCSGRVIPQIGDISSEIHANVEELEATHSLRFSLPGEYPLQIDCADSIFDAEIPGGKAVNGRIPVKIKTRKPMLADELHQLLAGNTHGFSVRITSPDSKYFVANPEVPVSMADHIQSRVSLAESAEEIAVAGVSWYDSFLWRDASAQGEVEIDLAPEFENVVGSEARLSMALAPSEGEPCDFRVWFNGKEIAEGESFDIVPASPAMLKIRFDADAKTGKRYFSLLRAGSQGLDLANGQPIDEFEGISLRSKYSVDWNPLKTLVFWLAVLCVALLLVWLLLLKRIFFPAIKVARIEFSGPGSYYLSKKIKGARKVVCTSRKKKQNVLSRIMTGEIRYVQAEHFAPDIEILPVGSKKKVKLHFNNQGQNSWDIVPSSIFAPYDKAALKHRSLPYKMEIEFS